MNDSPVIVGCWQGESNELAQPVFVDARRNLPAHVRGVSIIVDAEHEEVARSALEGGATRVFLSGTSARMGDIVARLASDFGAERLGVWADVAPMEVRWRLETESNADFKTLAPSMPEPCWEMLAADGTRTGHRVDYWLERMFDSGATAALVRTDLATYDDRDLNVCAGLVERFAERLWMTPASAAECSLDEWTRYGHASRFVLPESWSAALAGRPGAEADLAA